MNEKAEKTRAQICGMSHEKWKEVKAQSGTHRSRGRAPKKRPESSLWDAVDGQESLFDVPAENAGGGQ